LSGLTGCGTPWHARYTVAASPGTWWERNGGGDDMHSTHLHSISHRDIISHVNGAPYNFHDDGLCMVRLRSATVAQFRISSLSTRYDAL